MEENRERLAAALESLGDGVAVARTDGTVCYVNPAFERLTGLTTQEIVGKDGRFLLAEQYSEELFQHILEVLRQQKSWTGSSTIRKRDGSRIEVQITVTPRAGTTDELTEYVIIVRDVTECKRTEEALQIRMRLQEAMAAISTDFAVLSPQNADKGIARAVQKVGEFAGADSAYALLFSRNSAKAGCVHK